MKELRSGRYSKRLRSPMHGCLKARMLEIIVFRRFSDESERGGLTMGSARPTQVRDPFMCMSIGGIRHTDARAHSARSVPAKRISSVSRRGPRYPYPVVRVDRCMATMSSWRGRRRSERVLKQGGHTEARLGGPLGEGSLTCSGSQHFRWRGRPHLRQV